jgi:predicted RNA binding protein YcfA (HicA-like mRNA interferase family)
MAKPMKYRNVEKALRKNNCVHVSTRGDHEKWVCPCKQHIAIVVRDTEVSAGVVRDIIVKLECLQKGWLQ